jgi:hypothetical protein
MSVFIIFFITCKTPIADGVCTIKLVNNHATYNIQLILGINDNLIDNSLNISGSPETDGEIVIIDLAHGQNINYNLTLTESNSVNRDWLVRYDNSGWQNITPIPSCNANLFAPDKTYIITVSDSLGLTITQ